MTLTIGHCTTGHCAIGLCTLGQKKMRKYCSICYLAYNFTLNAAKCQAWGRDGDSVVVYRPTPILLTLARS